jgi:hypothetical protein
MTQQTLYVRATEEMNGLIRILLDLSEKTAGFTNPPDEIWVEEDAARLLLGGLGYHPSAIPQTDERKVAWLSRSALAFSVELAATAILYERIQPYIEEMIGTAYRDTDNFRNVSSEWVHANPHLLPVIMHAVGTFSKATLNKLVGAVSDAKVSRPASKRLAQLATQLQPGGLPSPSQVRERMKATTEGIVRDLTGRLLLEQFVENALKKAGVPYRPEKDYQSLSGVVYDFRADFVIPDELTPLAFIEVRKSSTRHASLYAKDKMFSAINWKGRHPNCIGVIVVDGSWSRNVLEVMARVFDYVVPLSRVSEVCQVIQRYLNGDRGALRWLINFSIEEARL